MDTEHARRVCGAYLMIAFADARLDPAEEARFLASLVNDPRFPGVSTARIGPLWTELVARFRDNYVDAADAVSKSVAAAASDPVIAEQVVWAARAAIVADERLSPQEEAALDRLARALGREEGSL